MIRALLQLDDYWVESLSVKARTDGLERAAAADVPLPRIKCEVFRASDEPVYKVGLGIVVGPKTAAHGIPYEFRLHLSGVFSFPPDADEEVQERILYVSGPAMLYGIARGIVAEATAQGPHGRYILPSVNFVELMDRNQRKVLRQQED